MEKLIIEDFGILAGNWPLAPDKPSLIFIHGAALSKGFWAAQVEDLSDIVNTIAIDLPGHKDSKGLACERISDCAASVAHLIEQIQAPNPILCGLSMGGAVSLELLITKPDIFKAAILMNTGARLKVFPFIFESIEKDYSQYLDLAVDFSVSNKSDKAKIKEIMNNIAVTKSDVALKDFTACDQFDVMDRLGEIKAKVLVVVGDEDNITPPKYGEYLHKNIPGSELAVIAEAGHLSPLEKPAEVVQIIRNFIRVAL
ncbi:MAG: alpha/beta hydrolase [Desulfobacteraceae bacterium]|nr:alpha/beta hydrolase [Desulfobacteraceae bacterium]MBC2754510.1 alpha/beta hydrolase [Desulfobacteraceae bacterium]